MFGGIAFMGVKKTAEALIRNLIVRNVFDRSGSSPAHPASPREPRCRGDGIRVLRTAKKACGCGDIVVLAVKPRQIPEVFAEGLDMRGKILANIVVNLTMKTPRRYVPDAKILRVMPITTACSGGTMGYCYDPSLTDGDGERVMEILGAARLAAKVQEEYMNAITGIAGSSTVFMYMVIDAMADAGVPNGLFRANSIRLTTQSILGTTKVVLKTGKYPDALRDEVRSSGETTIVWVRAAENMGLRAAIIVAMDSTVERSR